MKHEIEVHKNNMAFSEYSEICSIPITSKCYVSEKSYNSYQAVSTKDFVSDVNSSMSICKSSNDLDSFSHDFGTRAIVDDRISRCVNMPFENGVALSHYNRAQGTVEVRNSGIQSIPINSIESDAVYLNPGFLNKTISNLKNIILKKEVKLSGYLRQLSSTEAELSRGFNPCIESDIFYSIDERIKDICELINEEFLLESYVREELKSKIERTSNCIRSTKKKIDIISRIICKKLGRNRRSVYRKITSFHFKNLDDYHDFKLAS